MNKLDTSKYTRGEKVWILVLFSTPKLAQCQRVKSVMKLLMSFPYKITLRYFIALKIDSYLR